MCFGSKPREKEWWEFIDPNWPPVEGQNPAAYGQKTYSQYGNANLSAARPVYSSAMADNSSAPRSRAPMPTGLTSQHRVTTGEHRGIEHGRADEYGYGFDYSYGNDGYKGGYGHGVRGEDHQGLEGERSHKDWHGHRGHSQSEPEGSKPEHPMMYPGGIGKVIEQARSDGRGNRSSGHGTGS
ncbi:MAG: hypothetical protein L6R41_001105 [Letrouitia leprolyta]|nr:MAG: hypothetical protein L6R41_001105 [Letrouitia leprolyta]